MFEILSLIVAAALVNNLLFIQLLGVSSLSTVNQRLQPAFEIAGYTALVMIVSTTINQLLFWFLLAPLGLAVLKLVCFAVVSATISTVLAVLVREYYPLSARQQAFRFFLAGSNSAVIGVSLQQAAISASLSNFIYSLATSIGTALGFALALIGFAALQLRLSISESPEAFSGNPVLLISAGIAAMSFLGFAGLL